MSIAEDFVTGGMNVTQQQQMGVMMANIYKGAFDATGDKDVADHVLEVFISGILKNAAAQNIPKKTKR